MCKPHDSSGYLLDPFFSCPASHRIKERKSIKSAFSRADNGKESQAPARGTAATFGSIKPCTSITPQLNQPPREDFPLQRLSQPRARYYFNFAKSRGVRTSETKSTPSTHTNISKSQLYLCSDTHQSASQEGFWTGCKFLYYFQKKQNNPPTPAPRLLRCCCK